MMSIRTSYFIALAVVAALTAAGCASVTPTTVNMQSPVPEAPEGAKYQIYAVAEYKELAPGEWLTVGYVADMPGFPLPLFSDPDKKDVTTAHLTFCTPGTIESGMSEFAGTQFYDETPDGDFSNPDSLCGGEEGVRDFGGDRTEEPYDPEQGFVRTVVDRIVELEMSDGTTAIHPAPQGTKWHGTWKEDFRTGLLEILVFSLPGMEPEMEAETN